MGAVCGVPFEVVETGGVVTRASAVDLAAGMMKGEIIAEDADRADGLQDAL